MLKIIWTSEYIQFILAGYASFQRPIEIAAKFIAEFSEQLAPIEAEIGSEKLAKRVREKVKVLSPNSKQFPEQYRPEFERLRLAWTETARHIRGYHRTGRLQVLEDLLEETLAYPVVDEKGFTMSAKVNAVSKIISEMRNEGDKAQIMIETNEVIQDKTDETRDFMRLMTPEHIKELENATANGKPIAPIVERIKRDIRLNAGGGHTGASGTEVADSTEPREITPQG